MNFALRTSIMIKFQKRSPVLCLLSSFWRCFLFQISDILLFFDLLIAPEKRFFQSNIFIFFLYFSTKRYVIMKFRPPRHFQFQKSQNGLKWTRKYKLYYSVSEDDLRSPHGTDPSCSKYEKIPKGMTLESNKHTHRKSQTLSSCRKWRKFYKSKPFN